MLLYFSLQSLSDYKVILTIPAPMPQQAATAKMLKTALPTMVPTPISPSVMNVPITFTNSSGADVAAAMNVAPATSLDIFNAVQTGTDMLSILNVQHTCLFFLLEKKKSPIENSVDCLLQFKIRKYVYISIHFEARW